MLRKIVAINEEKCNGCGACANACHEHAIVMINGKAKLIKDDYCDGLGDCLPACPADAISIIEREAAEYDEAAVKARIAASKQTGGTCDSHQCPGVAAHTIKSAQEADTIAIPSQKPQSKLMQWPVQIKLMPIKAPYYENANLLIAADCTAYAYAAFHEDYMKNHITVIGCPKLDEGDYTEKLCEIIKQNAIKSIKILRMEVPCCGGLERAAIEAMRQSGKMLPWQVVTVTCDGKIVAD
ncbi:MAG: 4Fe-4S binding protein [Lachnospiraceae bacterium]|nr:4Fe-4S binding protein [Lachnospiraceae bacterium]